MAQTVLVPGLYGCKMVDVQGRTIWPPGETTDPIDTETLSNLIVDPATTHGSIISSVLLCGVDVYGPVIDLIKSVNNYVPFSYDWRVDVRTAASALGERLATLPSTDDIQIVSHSMGGLVTRWLLECGEFVHQPWFTRIKLAVFVATPHLGAPLALFRILGNDSKAGALSLLPNWATELMAKHPEQWPSGYQLLTPGDIDCVTEPDSTRRDIPEVFHAQLSAVGLQKMQEVYTKLEHFAKPRMCRYVSAHGKGSPDTVVGVVVDQASNAHEQFGDGDGTVPTWSAHPAEVIQAAAGAFEASAVFVADHVGILGNRMFLAQLKAWLGSVRIS
jgi:hypothetical protein